MRTVTIVKTAVVPDSAGNLFDTDEALVAFWSKVAISAEGECWPWMGSGNGLGYGQFRLGKLHLSHRLAFRDVGGQLADSDVLRHICHNRPCCNPKHLMPGTQKDNMQDAVRAGRLRPPDGRIGGAASAAARRARTTE